MAPPLPLKRLPRLPQIGRRLIQYLKLTTGRWAVLSIRKLICTFALASVVTLSSALGIAADNKPSDVTVHRSAISIDNFGTVNTTYYRGAQPVGRDYADLASLGIKLVIDLQADGDLDERQLAESAGMKFVRIPMTTQTAPTGEQL